MRRELLLFPAEQIHQRRIVQTVPRHEIPLAARLREAVPRAHQLAVVAAEDTVADGCAHLPGDAALQLDGEVRDAAARVELPGAGEGLCGADIEAGAAAAAVGGVEGRVGRQRDVGVDLAQEKPRPGLGVDEQRVLADPAQTGFLCEPALQHRSAVDEGPQGGVRAHRADALREFGEAVAENLVIVAAQRVAGHVAALAVCKHCVRLCGLRGPVVHACRDHAYSARQQELGAPARFAVAGHVVHLAVMAGGEPVAEMRVVRREIDRGEAERLQPQLPGPAADVTGQCGVLVRCCRARIFAHPLRRRMSARPEA